MDTAAGKKQVVASTAFELDGGDLSRIKKAGTYFIEVRALSVTGAGTKQVSLKLG